MDLRAVTRFAAFWLTLLSACVEPRPAGAPDPQASGVHWVWEGAKLRGVDFRAVGNEPGWSLEILSGDRITFVTDYGQTRVSTPLPEPRVEPQAARITYRAQTGAHALTLVIEPGPCHDSMSGEALGSRATVVLDAREHRGCGRALP